jgi:hypothetical protein
MPNFTEATDRQTDAETLQRLATRWEELDAAILLGWECCTCDADADHLESLEEERREVERQYHRLNGI